MKSMSFNTMVGVFAGFAAGLAVSNFPLASAPQVCVLFRENSLAHFDRHHDVDGVRAAPVTAGIAQQNST